MTQQEEALAGLAFGAEWNLDYHIGFSFEVPVRRLEALLPDGVEAVEPLPGTALLNLIHARYLPGNAGETRPFDEIVASVMVQPDLSLDMPVPRLTLYVLSVLSNSQRFVDYKVPALKMPVRCEPSLGSEIRADRLGSEVRDGRGPIFSLANTTAQATFKDRSFAGQFFACTDSQGALRRGGADGGQLHHSVWRWWGPLHETQKSSAAVCVIHDHPFFGELGLDGLKDSHCYMQQVSRPGEVVRMRTYETRLLSRA